MQLFFACLFELLPSWLCFYFKIINLTISLVASLIISLAIGGAMSIASKIGVNLSEWFL